MKLSGLGYIGFTVPDPTAWLSFGTDILGVMPARALPGEGFGTPGVPGSGPPSARTGVGPDGSVYLKMDDYQWRIGLHPGDTPGVAYLGFEVADADALAQAIDEVAAAGVAIKAGTPEEASARGVQGLAWCTDPSGNRVELFHSSVLDFKFVSPTGTSFVTGDLGLGHALLFVTDMDASLDFYRNALGFKRSDFVNVGPGMSAQFLRCTRRHHSIGLVHVGPFAGVQHMMLEVTTIDAVGAALDRATEAGYAITSTLGRHRNDNMVSFYMSGPSGFDVEVGFDGVLVDDSWRDREFVEGDIWGHKGMSPESLMEDGQSLS